MDRRRGKHLKPKTKSRRKLPAFLSLTAALMVAASAWGVAAKYMQERRTDSVIRAREFYFSSDLLVEGGTTYRLNPGTASVTFVLSKDEDDLRTAEMEIAYAVTTTGGTLSSTQGNIEDDPVSVTLSGLQDGGNYTVTAVGSAGYEKTLWATFAVQESPTGFYMYLDTRDPAYVLLTVWTENRAGEVSVSFPGGLIPDATDSNLAGITNYAAGGTYASDRIVQTYEVYESRTYRFFKENPADRFSVDAFSVMMDDDRAEVKIPG